MTDSDDFWLDDEAPKEDTPDGLIVLSDYFYEKQHGRIGTGFKSLDFILGGLGEASLTVLTGKRGSGKSTLAGQLALNAIQNGHKVCFYSGELSAHMFQNWVFSQASGDTNMIKIQDQFGNDFWIVEPIIESRIRSWLGKNLILYDNKVNKHSERNSILERFKIAKEKYGCTLFFVDNMMTAKFSIDKERDYWRAQSNFAGELVDFAQENSSHVILVAHPKKGDSGDINDDVSGSSDITNRASNVIQVKRTTDQEQIETNADAFITISKNRDYGRIGKIRMKFHPASRRLMDMDNENFEDYNWVDHF